LSAVYTLVLPQPTRLATRTTRQMVTNHRTKDARWKVFRTTEFMFIPLLLMRAYALETC
jgi:hypothetical protein